MFTYHKISSYIFHARSSKPMVEKVAGILEGLHLFDFIPPRQGQLGSRCTKPQVEQDGSHHVDQGMEADGGNFISPANSVNESGGCYCEPKGEFSINTKSQGSTRE